MLIRSELDRNGSYRLWPVAPRSMRLQTRQSSMCHLCPSQHPSSESGSAGLAQQRKWWPLFLWIHFLVPVVGPDKRCFLQKKNAVLPGQGTSMLHGLKMDKFAENHTTIEIFSPEALESGVRPVLRPLYLWQREYNRLIPLMLARPDIIFHD
ncbi:hypothetical protein EI42_04702 [Thermosporothrix hazakensis]|uniref:Uncharacterized protein n=1 Tax=Thermosporothrix hazakensis TaxID=644383 RepID=A0A326U2K7_THEHA|nr:hypothetical protein EI42_04702 [Thermosporothrix hazakensis]